MTRGPAPVRTPALLRRRHALGLAVAVATTLVFAACGQGPDADDPDRTGFSGVDSARITTDTVAADKPGTILRFGPAEPEVAAGPFYPPVVVGDEGQISIYEGFFLVAPCSRPLRADASRAADTIVVRLISEPAASDADCQDVERPTGYALLAGQFEPGDYPVRLIHQGDLARETPLDTVYEDITVEPNPR